MSQFYQFSAEDFKGENIEMSAYKGKVVLVVNTASACGFTPQYEGLQNIYKAYQDQGFEILAFPCNQFGQQEKGSNDEIKSFCDLNFNISFPLFAKIDVNGDQTHPLFNHLKQEAPGILGTKKIKWNFTKFLIGKDGQVIKRYAPTTKPQAIEADIKAQLA